MKSVNYSIIFLVLIFLGTYQSINAQTRKLESKTETEPKIKEVEHTEYAPVKEAETKTEPRTEEISPAVVEHKEITSTREVELKSEPQVVKAAVNGTPESPVTKSVPMTRKPSFSQIMNPVLQSGIKAKPIVVDSPKK